MDFNDIYLFLMHIKGFGPKTIGKFLSQNLGNIADMMDLYNVLQEQFSNKKSIKLPDKDGFLTIQNRVQDILEQTEADGEVIINYKDEHYPPQFLSLSDKPLLFFAKGNISALKRQGIAVVGTRAISPLGEKIGFRFGEVLSENGKTVIGGLAKGCDTAGHKGCLNKHGVTIAILGTPLNQVYPKENVGLARQILEANGCLISEYPIGTPVTPYNFVKRDRLQCGLADGVIVVETGVKGGTMQAVHGAQQLGKPVGCFNYTEQHYVDYPHSLGNKKLIQDGYALALHDQKSIDDFLRRTEHCNDSELSLF